MEYYISVITGIFQIFVFCITGYYLIIAVFGLFRKNKEKDYTANKKYALIVAAHNEEVVIGNLLDSMGKLNYPKELYDVFVIADNCTDKTAEISRAHGVKVFERNDKEKRGKGYALEWMFDKIFKMKENYDAVAIFDADNLVSTEFLREINAKMNEGFKVVQGYLDSKNPEDSWIASSYSIAFWSQNRMFQLSRENLGLSNQIGGTGFAIDINILKKLGWGATCLTEDLEFSCKLILNNERVGWAHDAVIYDEKPLTLKQSWSQRKRWMQGFADVATRFFTRLVKKAIKDKDFRALDCALYVAQPFVVLLLGISLVLSFLQANAESGLNIFEMKSLFGNTIWGIFLMVQFLFTPFVLFKDKKVSGKLLAIFAAYSLNAFIFPVLLDGVKNMYIITGVHALYTIGFFIISFVLLGKKGFLAFFRYLLYGIYSLTWIPITIQGILNKNNKEWSHTKHVRQIGIYDV
ncbi:glycosyltransferase family 2 protein [Clostridium intestinale]|uniref:Glycosyl transferase family protein n=1 Tax=Clostridium intestinale URNW TaxID=1294142 RepID=U2NKP2_9CLOT|nr:glycosyltransferase family 2 protein [Clostridium intestinale]ERK29708.1 glycosyl transferase family protein [Clostridium intestinale URNW]